MNTRQELNFNNFIQGKRLFITGGTGTLGHAIVQRARVDNWDCDITIYSRDPLRQLAMKWEYPEVRLIQGDIRDYDSLFRAMMGHDIVIHAAAQKHIPAGESNPVDTISINVDGSRNVALAALHAEVDIVVGISTDKVCHPANVYGNTKALMESIFLEFNQYGLTEFHLCRYGNVIGSAGSVLTVWQKQVMSGKPITITDPTMTRFWLTENQAVDIVTAALISPPGTVYIPRPPAASMEQLANCYGFTERKIIGRRPGEKKHEMLLTSEEWLRCREYENYFILWQEQQKPNDGQNHEYTSNTARQMTCEELREIMP